MIRYIEIDRLRGVAILFVLLHHARYPLLFPWPQDLPRLFMGGWTGVELFFIISGYAISSSLIPILDNSLTNSMEVGWRNTGRILAAFFLRRFFRLFPACLLGLVICSIGYFAFQQGQLVGDAKAFSQDIFGILTLTYNFRIISEVPSLLTWHWSLAIEAQFYLMFPFFLLMTLKHRPARVWMLAGYVLFISFVARPFLNPSWAVAEWPYFRCASHLKFDSFAIGSLLYILKDEIRERLAQLKNLPVFRWRAFLAMGLIGILGLLPTFGMAVSLSHPLINLVGGILVLLASQSNNSILVWKGFVQIFEWLGQRSYSLYLFHIPAFLLNQKLWSLVEAYGAFQISQAAQWAFVLSGYLIAALTAEFVFRFVEEPFNRFGKNLTQKEWFLRNSTVRNKILEEVQRAA